MSQWQVCTVKFIFDDDANRRSQSFFFFSSPFSSPSLFCHERVGTKFLPKWHQRRSEKAFSIKTDAIPIHAHCSILLQIVLQISLLLLLLLLFHFPKPNLFTNKTISSPVPFAVGCPMKYQNASHQLLELELEHGWSELNERTKRTRWRPSDRATKQSHLLTFRDFTFQLNF